MFPETQSEPTRTEQSGEAFPASEVVDVFSRANQPNQYATSPLRQSKGGAVLTFFWWLVTQALITKPSVLSSNMTSCSANRICLSSSVLEKNFVRSGSDSGNWLCF
jgi:hypothetical protein